MTDAPPPGYRRRTTDEVDERLTGLDYMGHWSWPRADRPYRLLSTCPAAEVIARQFLTSEIDHVQAAELLQAHPDIDSRTASAVRSWCYSLRTQRWVPDE